jgi:hypothetical protein
MAVAENPRPGISAERRSSHQSIDRLNTSTALGKLALLDRNGIG